MAEVRAGGGRESLLAAAVFAASYVAVAVTGQRLSTQLLENQWQLLPLDVLRDDPFGSVWHLHVQPPLWNLAVGVLDRWSPLSLAVSVQLLLLVSGCVVAASLAAVLRAIGLGRGAALGITALATINGPVLLAGFRPQYELPVAAMLTGLLALAVRAAGPRSARTLVVASLVVTALALTRSIYHPVLVPVVLAIVWRRHAAHVSRRAVLVAVAIPLVLLGGWLVKNEVLFGRATLASWDGMNLLRAVSPAVDDDDLEQLRADGEIALDGFFLPLDDYAQVVPPCTPSRDHPAVTVASRSIVSGDDDLAPVEEVSNFNHECFLPVYDVARSDALAIARAHPDRWLLGRVWALNNWFELPTPRQPNDSPLGTVVAKVTTVTFGGVAHPPIPSSWDPFWVNHWTLSLSILAGTALLVVAAVRRLRELRGTPSADATVMVLGAVLAGWTLAVGVVAELGEQARFRAPTDPIVMALAAVLVLRWWQRRRAVDPAVPASTDAPSSGQRRHVAVAATAVLVGVGLVNVREGVPVRTVIDEATALAQVQAVVASTTTTSSTTIAPGVVPSAPPVTAAAAAPVTAAPAAAPSPPPTAAPVSPPASVLTASRPQCDLVVHLGDSNLGMTISQFRSAYDDIGVAHVVDFSNGRGATTTVDGTTALQKIAEVRGSSPAEGRCWVIALSGADAMQSHLDGTDPRPTIAAIADAVGDEPAMWIPPVFTSATTEWNLVASTSYNVALGEVLAGRTNIGVFDWPSIALRHLDQFQPDGVHYTRELYVLLVDSVLDAVHDRWEIGS